MRKVLSFKAMVESISWKWRAAIHFLITLHMKNWEPCWEMWSAHPRDSLKIHSIPLHCVDGSCGKLSASTGTTPTTSAVRVLPLSDGCSLADLFLPGLELSFLTCYRDRKVAP